MKSCIPGLIATTLVGMAPTPAPATDSGSDSPAIDPAAVQILQKMTNYVRELDSFSVHTQTTLEEVLDSGQRVDMDVAAKVTVHRPDQVRAQRIGGAFNQIFYYDGMTLTLFNPGDGVYATQPAPDTIEGMLDFAREELGLTIPIADLVYRNAYAILMQGMASAIVLDPVSIGDVTCDHLAFARPDVDFQVWIAKGDRPLPCKYAVTDITTPELLTTVTVTSDWNLAPMITKAEFEFKAPEGAVSVPFLPAENGSGGQ